jgi:hypothetical protein
MTDKQVLSQGLDRSSRAQRAAALLELHRPGDPVVLPTVWDAWSARLAVDAGFAALTVGSHPVAESIGKADNEGMTFDDLSHGSSRSSMRWMCPCLSTSSPATPKRPRV